MGTNGKSVVSPWLKREEYDRTEYDSVFSKWKILIGPSDWENHLLNKDGAEKYRTQNLPNCSSCSGFYELGIVVSSPKSRLKVIPVYVGQADNVRTRLQQYGRGGAHLEIVQPNGELNGSVGHGLFTEVFSRDLSLAYRWVPTKNKREAEKGEKKLLGSFDYAWNKDNNGPRRVDDVLQKLKSPRQVGHRLKSPVSLENLSSFYANLETDDKVSIGIDVKEGNSNMCGVALGQGSVCVRPPVEGRKRCAEHKGMRDGSSAAKLITEGKSHELYVGMGPRLDGHQDQKFNYRKFKLLPAADKKPVIEDSSPICGVILVDGTRCTRTPVHRRERCEEHKGKKIQSSVSKSVSEEEEHYAHGPIFQARTHLNDYKWIYSQRSDVNKGCGVICGVDTENGRFCTRQPVVGRVRCEEHKGMRVKEQKSKQIEANLPSVFADSGSCKYNIPVTQTMSPKTIVTEDSSSTCGATTLDGSSCRRKPGKGSKWCWEHESIRVKELKSKQIEANLPSVFADSGGYKSNIPVTRTMSPKTIVTEDSSSTCGATTLDGSSCRRKPGKGSKWCWQHESMRVKELKSKEANLPSVFADSGGCKSNIPVTRTISPKTIVTEDSSSTCGATTLDGSSCRRKPGKGSKRCWQHEGMRVDWSSRNEPTCNSSSSGSFLYKSSGNEGFQSACGAMTLNGSACRRSPAQGRSRCWQHDGTRADWSSRNESTYNSSSCRSFSYKSCVNERYQSTCGAMTRNGSACKRSPAQGRSRCWQH